MLSITSLLPITYCSNLVRLLFGWRSPPLSPIKTLPAPHNFYFYVSQRWHTPALSCQETEDSCAAAMAAADSISAAFFFWTSSSCWICWTWWITAIMSSDICCSFCCCCCCSWSWSCNCCEIASLAWRVCSLAFCNEKRSKTWVQLLAYEQKAFKSK